MPATTAAALRRAAAAAGGAAAFSTGKKLHARVLTHGLLPDATLETALIVLYCRRGHLGAARKVFDAMSRPPPMLAHNILLAAYSRAGAAMAAQALSLLCLLLHHGLLPDRFSLPPSLAAAAYFSVSGGGGRGALLGAAVHGLAVRLGFLANAVVSGSVLDMYAKVGLLDDAVKLFDEMTHRDAVVWNCMVSGFARAGRCTDALNLFRRAHFEMLEVDSMAVPSILNACAKEGELRKGREVHGRMVRCLVLDLDTAVGNALIDMYAKCGCLGASHRVFVTMRAKNVVTWSTLISCYGVHGKGEAALRVYDEMVLRGVRPNCITFTSILSSCSHAGLVDDGRRIFESMGAVHGVNPSSEHFACMVDLLGRAGSIEEAVQLVKRMPVEPSASVWGALLSACVMHKNVEVGEIAAFRLFELEKGNPSNYVALCNIYEAVGCLGGVAGMRAKMRELGMVKTPGCSWVDVKGRAHAFYQGSVPRRLKRQIFEVLDRLGKEMATSETEHERAGHYQLIGH